MTGGRVSLIAWNQGTVACHERGRNDDRNLRHFSIAFVLSCFMLANPNDDSEPRKSIAEGFQTGSRNLILGAKLGSTAITPITSPGYRVAEKRTSLFVCPSPLSNPSVISKVSRSRISKPPADRPLNRVPICRVSVHVSAFAV